MQQGKQRAKIRGNAGRAVTVVAVAVGVMATAGSATAAVSAGPADPGVPVVAGDAGKKPGFFETYRGRHIMGWGRDDDACAYIDGMRLVVYPAGGGMYTSAVQGFKPERGLRAITKASVRALGEHGLAATTDEPKTSCPEFEVAPKTGK